MSSTNPKTRGGGGVDFFETPAWVTKLILPEVLPPSGWVLDPCAGRGAILRAALDFVAHDDDGASRPFPLVYALEIEEQFRDAISDAIDGAPVCIQDALNPAFKWTVPKRDGDDTERASLIIQNPPFKRAQEFVERALAEVAPGGTVAALLRAGFLETPGRLHLHTTRPADLYILPNRPGFTSDGGKDSALYAWFVWGPGRGGRWFMLPETPKDVRCPRKPRALV